jgi:hypothetical protein
MVSSLIDDLLENQCVLLYVETMFQATTVRQELTYATAISNR